MYLKKGPDKSLEPPAIDAFHSVIAAHGTVFVAGSLQGPAVPIARTRTHIF